MTEQNNLPKSTKKQIVVVGGGVIGLCCAYYLHKSGHTVTVVDAGEMGRACSFVNAGMIVPSHFEPLANPATLKQGLKYLGRRNAPVYLQPRCSLDLLRWCWQFMRFSNQKHVLRYRALLASALQRSAMLYQQLAESDDLRFSYIQRGLLVLCQSEAGACAEQQVIEDAKTLGLDAQWLNPEQLKTLEPHADFACLGAAYFKNDGLVDPAQLTRALQDYLLASGVILRPQTTIARAELGKGTVKSLLTTQGETISADEFVFAAGVMSSQLAKQFGLNLPMQGGKGFSFDIDKSELGSRNLGALQFKTPMLLSEAKVAVSPYADHVRFAGTMVISGTDNSIRPAQVDLIRQAANRYINGCDIQISAIKQVNVGLRPCSPDGLPYIGRAQNLSNLLFATGHNMIGVSLAPITGQWISQLIDEQAPNMGISAFNLQRF